MMSFEFMSIRIQRFYKNGSDFILSVVYKLTNNLLNGPTAQAPRLSKESALPFGHEHLHRELKKVPWRREFGLKINSMPQEIRKTEE